MRIYASTVGELECLANTLQTSRMCTHNNFTYSYTPISNTHTHSLRICIHNQFAYSYKPIFNTETYTKPHTELAIA